MSVSVAMKTCARGVNCAAIPCEWVIKPVVDIAYKDIQSASNRLPPEAIIPITPRAVSAM